MQTGRGERGAGWTRREWLAAGAGLAAVGIPAASSAETRSPLRPPYRVWFQPRVFHRDMELYTGMTLDANGWIDPALMALTGRATLRWVYGTNHPHADGPDYWRTECEIGAAGAGIAIDEWIPADNPSVQGWVAAGLRAGRQAHPGVFIAVWVTDPTPVLAGLVDDGTVDLVIIQGYTHAAARYGPHATVHWPTALRRCRQAVDLGIEAHSIFSFGHITADPDADGGTLELDALETRARAIREQFPAMPGIAFFEDDSDDSPRLREIVRRCDRISRDLWPDPPVA